MRHLFDRAGDDPHTEHPGAPAHRGNSYLLAGRRLPARSRRRCYPRWRVVPLAREAVRSAASRPRFLRRSADSRDGPRTGRDVPFRHRHLLPRRDTRLRHALGHRCDRGRSTRDGRGSWRRRSRRPCVLAHHADGAQRTTRRCVSHRDRIRQGTLGSRALLRTPRRDLSQSAAAGRDGAVSRHDTTRRAVGPRRARRHERPAPGRGRPLRHRRRGRRPHATSGARAVDGLPGDARSRTLAADRSHEDRLASRRRPPVVPPTSIGVPHDVRSVDAPEPSGTTRSVPGTAGTRLRRRSPLVGRLHSAGRSHRHGRESFQPIHDRCGLR